MLSNRRVIATIIIFLLAAAVSASDDRIYDDVRRVLANDPDVKGGTFDVDVQEGVVTIRGEVEKEKFRQKAERLAKKVKGVRKVVNELKLKR